jgi:hypothetical protein
VRVPACLHACVRACVHECVRARPSLSCVMRSVLSRLTTSRSAGTQASSNRLLTPVLWLFLRGAHCVFACLPPETSSDDYRFETAFLRVSGGGWGEPRKVKGEAVAATVAVGVVAAAPTYALCVEVPV